MKYYKEITASGTFTVPATGRYCVIAVGGGSAGSTANANTNSVGVGGEAGKLEIGVFDLIAGNNIAVTVGNGGAGGVGGGSGSGGGSTSFGALLTASGGTYSTMTIAGFTYGSSVHVKPNPPGGDGGYDKTQYGGTGARNYLKRIVIDDAAGDRFESEQTVPPTGLGGALVETGRGYGAGGRGTGSGGGTGSSGVVIIYRM